jgi:HprK-related kinase B
LGERVGPGDGDDQGVGAGRGEHAPPGLAEVIAGLEAAHPIAARLDLALAGTRVEVASNAPRLIEALATYFGEHVAPVAAEPSGRSAPDAEVTRVVALEGAALPPLPGDFAWGERLPGKEPKERYLDLADGRVVDKVRTGMRFAMTWPCSRAPARHLALGPCLANQPQVVNFIGSRFIQARLWDGSLLVHAAAVAWGGRGLAIAGPSGRGKSTLALALMSCGADFVSNDRLLIREHDGGLRAEGIPKHPRINPGTALANPDLAGLLDPAERARYQALRPAALWEVERKLDARIDLCFGPGRFPMTAWLDAVAVLGWRRGSQQPTRVIEIDLAARPDLLPSIAKPPGVFFAPRPGMTRWPPQDADYAALLARTRVLEVTGGVDFAEAAARCRELAGA